MTGILVAFKDYDPLGGIFGSKWIGFENFKFLFHSSDTIYILRNTLLYNVAFIILNTPFAYTASFTDSIFSSVSLGWKKASKTTNAATAHPIATAYML